MRKRGDNGATPALLASHRKGKASQRAGLHVTSDTFNKAYLEEWLYAGGNSSEEQNVEDFFVHIGHLHHHERYSFKEYFNPGPCTSLCPPARGSPKIPEKFSKRYISTFTNNHRETQHRTRVNGSSQGAYVPGKFLQRMHHPEKESRCCQDGNGATTESNSTDNSAQCSIMQTPTRLCSRVNQEQNDKTCDLVKVDFPEIRVENTTNLLKKNTKDSSRCARGRRG